MIRTGGYIVVATYTDHMYPSVCVEAVEKLGEKPLFCHDI